MNHVVPSSIVIVLALGSLGGCDGDIRERTYDEVSCSGILKNDNDKYECVRVGTVQQIDRSKLTRHTVTVNRRNGNVAFDGSLVGECRVADFDVWECVERSPARDYDSIVYRSGRGGGGYAEQWCRVSPDAPAAHVNCDQQYYGIPTMSDITRLRTFLRDQFCSRKSGEFCSWL
jgi:hypothetical protein